jgi:N-acetylglucosaminyldiphosphoundecaprenol N-acetyl-beta-D-mannosaminyltransferase
MERVVVLGVRVDALGVQALLGRVAAFIDADTRATIAYANVHVLNTAQGDTALRAFLNGVDVCYCDCGGVVLGARLLGHDLPGRMTGADWIWDLARVAEGRWRIFWLGGEPGVTEAAAAVLKAKHPGLEIVGDHGFHEDYAPVVARINTLRPHIVLVGMGTPTQERWVAKHRADLDVPVVWALGATADFISGKVSRGPKWLHQNQEWLARLVTEPRRLWRRYLVGNSVFLARVLRQRVR